MCYWKPANVICIDLPCAFSDFPRCDQRAQESSEIQDELQEKVDRLKAELVVFKSLMSDVSVASELGCQRFPESRLKFDSSKCSINSHP